MKNTTRFQSTLLVAAILALSAGQAMAMTKADYKAGKTSISATYKADKAACASMTANARDVCIEEAKAKEKVAKAEHEYAYTNKPADMTKVATAKAQSTYAVAKEKCDDQAGNAKDVCVKEAKAIEVKALADAKMLKKVSEARTAATQDKRDANYKVAAEKCESMASEAKASCIASAKAKFGKT